MHPKHDHSRRQYRNLTPGLGPMKRDVVTRSRAFPAIATGTGAIGSIALGAMALGAIAIGAIAIGRLAVGRARIKRLEIDELVVRRLRITERLTTPPDSKPES